MKRWTFLAGLLSLPLWGQRRQDWRIRTLPADVADCLGGKCDPGINRRDDENAPNFRYETIQQADGRVTYQVIPSWRTSKALNNQCPVCGMMAEPWTPKADTGVVCEIEVGSEKVHGWSPCPPPTERRIDCACCNVVYRQFAEDR